jgi:hypothetical protein
LNLEDARQTASAESTGALYKQVTSQGLCQPHINSEIRKALVKVLGETDPWFPDKETGPAAAKAARRACEGCQVRRQCLELALRQEQTVGDVWGVRGGLSAGERRIIVRSRRILSELEAGR